MAAAVVVYEYSNFLLYIGLSIYRARYPIDVVAFWCMRIISPERTTLDTTCIPTSAIAESELLASLWVTVH